MSYLTYQKVTFIILVITLILSFDVVLGKMRIVTPKWKYKCDRPGSFPHASDCQRQDDQNNIKESLKFISF